jgi:hypothetical protein
MPRATTPKTTPYAGGSLERPEAIGGLDLMRFGHFHLRAGWAATLCAGVALACGYAAAQPPEAKQRIERINGHPNLNGVWQALNTANWNLEGQSAAAIEEFAPKLGALFAVPPGQSVVRGGKIPYLPAALERRERNRASWPAEDTETKCFRTGIPRQTYLPYPFEIVQGDDDILFVYEYATSNRTVRIGDNQIDPDEVLVDQWLGWSNGHWEGDTLVVEVFGNMPVWLDRAGNFHNGGKVTERYTLMGENHIWYEATIDDPTTFSRPWTIEMPLYRRMEPNPAVFEYKCVEFAEPLLYGELLNDPIK